jgi:rhodanese-related sulfurtransferase
MIAQIHPTEFKDWLAAQATATVLLDVREAWEVDVASIQSQAAHLGFEWLHIPMNSIPAQLETLSGLVKDKSLICLCHHGMRSQNVARYLAQNGLAQSANAIVNLSGGIAAWSHSVDHSVPQY